MFLKQIKLVLNSEKSMGQIFYIQEMKIRTRMESLNLRELVLQNKQKVFKIFYADPVTLFAISKI